MKGERLKLTMLERITVSRFLPTKGNYELMKASEELAKPALTFTEEESRKYDVRHEVDKKTGQQLVWFNKDASEGYESDIKLPPIVSACIAKQLKELSEKEELEPVMLSVYEKFVMPPVPIVKAKNDS